ncbi:Aspartate/glutamate/uridylate kinase [Flagelloscypha sp. PMI_526]|nr:Aspartate/glutamate/uridylate kinase [Flagelloscypha sp. PMI_526]
MSSSNHFSDSESLSSSSSSSPGPSTPPNMHQNSIDPSTTWIVQKFGGTSIGKFPVEIARDIVANYIDGNKVAVVCSARSGSTKALGTTNLLLKAAAEALQRSPPRPQTEGSVPGTPFTRAGRFGSIDGPTTPPLTPRSRSSSGEGACISGALSPLSVPESGQQLPSFNVTVDVLRHEHVTAARLHVKNETILRELEDEIERDCDWLRGFLAAAKVIDEISLRSKDTIVGLGEQMACKLMTAVLQDHGIDAEYVSLDNIVPLTEDLDPNENGSLNQGFYDRVAVAVGERIKQCDSRVPVVTGFFGPVPGSLLAQIGRGYTDLLASLLAVGLEASEVQIWKEVDGIFTADPRKVPTARLLDVISPEEAAELTYYGSEVVHPFTMEQVIRRDIPIRIKNVMNPQGNGTVIQPEGLAVTPDSSNPPSPSPSNIMTPFTLSAATKALASSQSHHPRLPTAVTIKEHILVLNVSSNRRMVSHGFLASVFGTLDKFGVVVDLISTSQVYVSMAIESQSLSTKVRDRLVRELERHGTVTLKLDMSILSLVGTQMRSMVGIAGRMFTTLAQGNVNIDMISQGANEINISCVIPERDAVKALNLIHQSCLMIKPEGPRGRVGPWLF